MTKQCLFCQKSVNNSDICLECKKNPFLAEEYRKILASENKKEELAKCYGSDFASFENINSAEMWNFYMDNHKVSEGANKITQNRISLTAALFPPTVKNVLDIGIGYGFVTEKVYQKFPNIEISGVDISSSALEKVKQKIKGTFKIGSISDLPWDENSFECVMLLETLEHVPADNVFSSLEQIKKILKPGGYLLMSVPVHEDLNQNTFRCPSCQSLINPNGHVRSYSPELISKELEMAGFEVIKEQAVWAYGLLNRLNLFKLFNRKCANVILLAKLKNN